MAIWTQINGLIEGSRQIIPEDDKFQEKLSFLKGSLENEILKESPCGSEGGISVEFLGSQNPRCLSLEMVLNGNLRNYEGNLDSILIWYRDLLKSILQREDYYFTGSSLEIKESNCKVLCSYHEIPDIWTGLPKSRHLIIILLDSISGKFIEQLLWQL